MRSLSLSINGGQLTITWQAPSMANGPESITYSISVSGINLVNNDISSSTVNVMDTMHTIDILPYSNYTAEVVAFTSA